MISSQFKKIFFWVFGLLFSVFLYFFLQRYTNNSLWVILSISLVIIFLFYVVGEILSHISSVYFYLLNNDPKKTIVQVKQEEEKQKIKDVVKNIKKVVSFVVSQNYSKESIKMLNEYIGIDIDETEKLINVTKKLSKIKWGYWISGLIFAIINVFIIYFVDFFSFLRSPIYVSILINIVIFLLFYIIGLLVIKLPDSFYLKIIKYKEIQKQEKALRKKNYYEKEQKASIENITNAIKYLLKIKVPKEKIVSIITSQGFSKKVAEEIIANISKEQLNEVKSLPSQKNSAVEKLFISKIYEEFMKLKEINKEISTIKESLMEVEGKQKEIEQNLKILKSKNFSSITKNLETEMDDRYYLKKGPSKSKINHQIEAESGFKFSSDVYFLYNLILPQASRYKKEDIESFLLYQNYSLEQISDLMELFKANNIKFKEEKAENKFISFINKFFEK